MKYIIYYLVYYQSHIKFWYCLYIQGRAWILFRFFFTRLDSLKVFRIRELKFNISNEQERLLKCSCIKIWNCYFKLKVNLKHSGSISRSTYLEYVIFDHWEEPTCTITNFIKKDPNLWSKIDRGLSSTLFGLMWDRLTLKKLGWPWNMKSEWSEINREGRDSFENSKLICRVAHDELLNDII